jgi:diguanylate cyclase (GGDEF)-like protein
MSVPDSEDLSWIDYVQTPLFILTVTQARVLRMNAAFRRIMPQHCPDAPATLAAVVGSGTDLALIRYIHSMPEDGSRNTLSLTCTTVNGPMMLILHLAEMKTHRDTWVVTVDERTLFFQGVKSDSAEDTFRGIIQELPIGIDILDSSFRGVFYNRYSDSIYLYDPYYDLEMTEWFERAFPAAPDRRAARDQWTQAVAALEKDPAASQDMEWRVMCRDGQYRVLANRISRIGNHYTFIYWDITEQRRLEDQLRILASTDMLTKVFNRRSFFEHAEGVMGAPAAARRPASLILLDIDHFKRINDDYGHHAGDGALVAVANLCRSEARRGDIIARFGGEEFILLLPETPLAQAEQMADALRERIAAERIATAEGVIALTASLGVATHDGETKDTDQLVEKADKALYAAKRAGRNRVMVFPPLNESDPI